jgi:hypothetical protein
MAILVPYGATSKINAFEPLFERSLNCKKEDMKPFFSFLFLMVLGLNAGAEDLLHVHGYKKAVKIVKYVIEQESQGWAIVMTDAEGSDYQVATYQGLRATEKTLNMVRNSPWKRCVWEVKEFHAYCDLMIDITDYSDPKKYTVNIVEQDADFWSGVFNWRSPHLYELQGEYLEFKLSGISLIGKVNKNYRPLQVLAGSEDLDSTLRVLELVKASPSTIQIDPESTRNQTGYDKYGTTIEPKK